MRTAVGTCVHGMHVQVSVVATKTILSLTLRNGRVLIIFLRAVETETMEGYHIDAHPFLWFKEERSALTKISVQRNI